MQKFTENPSVEIDWEKCEKLDQFVKETLRLWGPNNMLIYRVCLKNHKLGSILIKKGTRIGYAPFYFHRHPRYFPNPDEFVVERFSPENRENIPKRVYMPFYEGARACSGVYLGEQMVRCLAVALLTQFEIDSDPDFEPSWLLTISVEIPDLRVRIRPRQT